MADGPRTAWPALAVCIPTYNQSAFLAEAVESAFALDYPDIEVWVADDASTDDTPAVLAHLERAHPGLRVIRRERNLGIAGNVDDLLRRPEATYIVRLDSDDRLRPAFARRLVGLMERHPEAGYAHANVREIDAAGRPRKLRLLGPRPAFVDAERALRQAAAGYKVAANVCLFRRAALVDVGYLDTAYRYGEDYDLAVRLADRGWGNVHDAEVLADYRVWDDWSPARAGRHGPMVQDLIRLYDRLEVAYRRRGWDLAPVLRARGARAVDLAEALAAGPDAGASARQIERLAGESPVYRRYRALRRWGLASPWLTGRRLGRRAARLAKRAVAPPRRPDSDAGRAGD